MIDKCELCKEEPPAKAGERFCKACRKVVIDRGREANRERNTAPKLVSEAGGRKCRSNQVIGGSDWDRHEPP